MSDLIGSGHEPVRRPDAERVREALRALPSRRPPDDAWQRLSARAASEGVLTAPRARHTVNAVAWRAAALFGGIALLVSLRPWHSTEPAPTVPMPPVAALQTDVRAEPAGPVAIDSLMDRSRELERELRGLPSGPSVQRVGTASTITALEDRVAMIDAQLSLAGDGAASPDARRLWRERVSLMDTLVTLRRADARQVWL